MASELFNKDKNENFSEWYQEILKQAEIVDLRYPVKGFPVYMPYGFGIMKKMFQKLETRWDEVDYKATYFPVMVPEEYLEKEKQHAEGVKIEVFWVDFGQESKDEGRRALRPTSEAVMYPVFANWIRSHNDLPLKVYQTCSVYRLETKQTRPLFRGREVYWNEAHAATRDAKACQENVDEGLKVYTEFFEKDLGLATLLLKRPEWDKFPGAVNTYAFETIMPDGKLLQIGTNHFLGDSFAKAFNVTYTDENNEEQYAFLSSHGTAMRTVGCLLAMHGDSKGLVLPFQLAPIQLILTPLLFKGKDEQNEKVLKVARELKDSLKQMGFRAGIDESDKRPGEKFYYWEMKGVPVRVEVGPKDVETQSVVLVRRDTNEKITVPYTDLMKFLQTLKGIELAMNENLHERSYKQLTSSIKDCDSLEDARKHVVSEKGLARVPFCSMQLGGEECAKKIKDEFQAEVRGTPLNEKQPENKTCIVCGKPAKHLTYIGKSY